ncbi:HNH endonuclease [Fictibacillus sp. Mic-4]|uniref:HNH endonuclease n=1 Tax=Fictibacillus sp. Mic-4 TaxID=3132826 RepID=UPI003CF7E4A7
MEVKSDYKDREWLFNKYTIEELSMMQISKLCGVSEKTIQYYMNKFDIPRRNGSNKITKSIRKYISERAKGKPTWNHGMKGNYQKWTKRGENAPGYRGGVSEKGNRGYRKFLMPEHPYCDANGYVFEHRLVCEKLLGRYLTEDEIVHHRDRNPLNNEPSNLFIFYGHAAHRAFHTAQNRDSSLTEEEFCRGEDYVWF